MLYLISYPRYLGDVGIFAWEDITPVFETKDKAIAYILMGKARLDPIVCDPWGADHIGLYVYEVSGDWQSDTVDCGSEFYRVPLTTTENEIKLVWPEEGEKATDVSLVWDTDTNQYADESDLFSDCVDGCSLELESLLNGGMSFRGREFHALACACHEGHLDIVKKLVSMGVDVNRGNPISLAWGNGHTHVVDYLLDQGATLRGVGISSQE